MEENPWSRLYRAVVAMGGGNDGLLRELDARWHKRARRKHAAELRAELDAALEQFMRDYELEGFSEKQCEAVEKAVAAGRANWVPGGFEPDELEDE